MNMKNIFLSFYWKDINNWGVQYKKYLNAYKTYTWNNVLSLENYPYLGSYLSFFKYGVWIYKKK